MYCPNCGKEISDDSNRCRFCDSAITHVRIMDPLEPSQMDDLPKNPAELLQLQVRLLDQVNRSIIKLQETQTAINESLQKVRLNQDEESKYLEPDDVVITDMDIPFGSVLSLTIKWVIACFLISIFFAAISFIVWIIMSGLSIGVIYRLLQR